jgi:hypothetical protein
MHERNEKCLQNFGGASGMDGITWKTQVFYEVIVLKSFLKEEDIAQAFRFSLFILEARVESQLTM